MYFLSNGFDRILFLSLTGCCPKGQNFYCFKYTSMSRLFSSVFVFLLFFSCSPHLSVHQINTQNIQVDIRSSSIDSLVQVILSPFRDSISGEMSRLVAVSATPLVKDKPESKLTNLVSDILLEYGTGYCVDQKIKVIPDASYVNYGGLRASLPQGEITVGHIFELMPFENEIVLIKISGESVLKMAERIASRGGEGVAGLRLGIRNEKPATLSIGGKAVEPAAVYWIVTNDYIANGGDQMDMLSNPVERINTGLKIRDVLILALSERYQSDGIIHVKEDGRIFHEQ